MRTDTSRRAVLFASLLFAGEREREMRVCTLCAGVSRDDTRSPLHTLLPLLSVSNSNPQHLSLSPSTPPTPACDGTLPHEHLSVASSFQVAGSFIRLFCSHVPLSPSFSRKQEREEV